jgi:hypothetical protein
MGDRIQPEQAHRDTSHMYFRVHPVPRCLLRTCSGTTLEDRNAGNAAHAADGNDGIYDP